MENYELYHHGVKGQKWGVRKDRSKSTGSRLVKKMKTSAAAFSAKRKARKEEEAIRKREQRIMKTPLKKLTAAELAERAKILQAKKTALDLEKQCKQASKETQGTGKAFVGKMFNEMVVPAAIDSGKNVLKDYFIKVGKDKLGLNAQDALASLRRQADEAGLRNTIAQLSQTEANARNANAQASQREQQAEQERITAERMRIELEEFRRQHAQNP